MHPLHKCLLFHLLAYLGRNADGSEIIDGKLAPENSMLYMASVQNSTGHVCGGFLISEDFVLTAAHCDDNITHVVLGTHNLKRVNNVNKISIKRNYKHESYKNYASGDDIMLLKLSTNVSLNGGVETILLPPSEIEMNKQENCQVAGWGARKTDGKFVDDLRVVNVTIINLVVCKDEWNYLPANVTCAGGYKTKKGFCQGDSGGPLVCNGKAVGVASYNDREIKCNYPDIPNVYTDVSKYLPWINGILKHYE